MTSSTIAVAVSGGIDSLAALLLAKEAGVKVLALHAILHENAAVPSMLPQICERLQIPLHILDLKDIFRKKVIQYFIESYRQGFTPNPCAVCNQAIKFGYFLEAAQNLGAEALSTGHYAAIGENGEYGTHIASGLDAAKDQSYFLSLVPRSRLKYIRFPLAKMTKADTRAYVASLGFSPPLPAESQDICFLEGHTVANYLRRFLQPLPGPVGRRTQQGTCEVIGQHSGLWQFTCGQRKGLGIAWKEPLYVVAKDIDQNALIVTNKRNAFINGCVTVNCNYQVPKETWPKELYVRLRYNQDAIPARISFREDEMNITLITPMFVTSPGQLATIYDPQGRVLGGGIISSTFPSGH